MALVVVKADQKCGDADGVMQGRETVPVGAQAFDRSDHALDLAILGPDFMGW